MTKTIIIISILTEHTKIHNNMKTAKTIIISILTLFAISCDNNSTDNSQKSDARLDTLNKNESNSSTMSITAIKGNHLDKSSAIFATFKYIDLKADRSFSTIDSCSSFLIDNYMAYTKKDIAIRGLWYFNGWTIIYDPEMVDFLDDTALISISKNLNTDVLTFVIQKTSDTYGFAKYNQKKLRTFFATGSEVTENSGTPLTEEEGLNINKGIFVDDIITLADKFGIDLSTKKTTGPFVAKKLGYNDELKKDLEKFKQ